MKFTKKDKEVILRCYGGDKKKADEDIPQIELAADLTEYEVERVRGKDRWRPITRNGAIRLLGRAGWVSGLVRSAFHRTSCPVSKDGRPVFFDSKAVFR